jgi:hypothetical protein
MNVVPDEIAIRRLFDELTGGQPPAPPDRYDGIKRRFRSNRIAQAAGTIGAIAAVVVVAVGVGTSASPVAPDTSPRSLPAWALPWPDHRNGSVPQTVLVGAVTAWHHEEALTRAGSAKSRAFAPSRKVIWYVGQKVAGSEVIAVVFEAESPYGPRLVAGWATAAQVMHGQPGWSPRSSPWVLYDVPAPRPAVGLFVGLNVHGTSARRGGSPDNWIVVLTDPRVLQVGWTAPGPSSRTVSGQGESATGSGAIGIAQTQRGLAVANTGQISGRVLVTQLVVHVRNLLRDAEPVGVPGNKASQVPQLEAPPPVPGKPGFTRVIELTGQGVTASDLTGINGRLAVRARCAGPGQLEIQFGRGSPRAVLDLSPAAARATLRSLGTIACDERVHELVTSVRLTSGDARGVVVLKGRQLAAYRADLGTAAGS